MTASVRPLLGHTVVRLWRIGLLEPLLTPPRQVALSTALGLSLQEGQEYEFVCRQARVLFARIGSSLDTPERLPHDLFIDESTEVMEAAIRRDEYGYRFGLRALAVQDGEAPILELESLELDPKQEGTIHRVDAELAESFEPFRIEGITEVWSGERERTWLAALTLWRDTQNPSLCLYFTANGIEILTPAEQQRRLADHPRVFGTVFYRYLRH